MTTHDHSSSSGTGDVDGLDDLDRQFADAAEGSEALLRLVQDTARDASPAGQQSALPCCGSLEQWVEQVFTATYARRATPTFRWCAQWWRHAEAISRLEALWRSWEALRLDPLLGMATWYRDYLDSQLPVLTGPAGPFADCDPTQHFDPAEPCLPHTPAPPGWWPPTPAE